MGGWSWKGWDGVVVVCVCVEGAGSKKLTGIRETGGGSVSFVE